MSNISKLIDAVSCGRVLMVDEQYFFNSTEKIIESVEIKRGETYSRAKILSKVLNLRFGLLYEEEKNFKQIAYDLDVSTERARDLTAIALRYLRHPSLVVTIFK